MRFKTVIKAAILLLIIGAVAGAVFLKSLDFNDYKGLLAEQVKAATGRDLVIRGDMDLALSLSPALAVHDISLSNASWGSRPEMLRVKRLEMQFRVLPLFSGKVLIDRLVLIAPDIFLETDNQGKGNWSFPEDKGEKEPSRIAASSPSNSRRSAFIPLIHEVRIKEGVLRFRDGKTGKTLTLSLKKCRGFAENVQAPTTITMEGTGNHHPFQIHASLGPISRLLDSPSPFPLQVEARLLGAILKIRGTVKNPLQARGLNLNLSAEGPSLTPLARAAGLETPPPGSFHLAARLSDSNATYSLHDIQATLGKSHLAGSVSVHTRKERRLIRAKVTELNWEGATLVQTHGPDKKRSPPSPKITNEPKRKRGVQKGQKKIFSDSPLPRDWLRAVDISLKLDKGRIHVGGMTLENLRSNIDLLEGRLTVSSLQADLAGGSLNGEITLDGTRPRLALETKVDMEKVSVGALLQSLRITDLVSSGMARIKIRLQGMGSSVRKLMAGLNGRISLIMGKGSLNSRYLDFAAADLVRLLVTGGAKKELTAVNCFVCRFDVKKGLATNQGLLLDTDEITVAGKGEVNFADESLDLTLKPRPKKTSLVSLAMPVHVGGTLAEPSIRPDTAGVIKGVAGALLGAAVLGPAGLLVPLVAKGTGDQNPCIEALEGKGEKTGNGGSGTEKRQESGITGLLKGLALPGDEKK